MNHADNQELLQLFVEHAPAAVAMFDREMRYMLASSRWLTECGIGNQDIIARSYYDLERQVPDGWKAIVERVLAGAIEKHELPFQRSDGTVDWMKWEICPWRNSTGEIGGAIVSREVISECRWATSALQQSEELINLLVEGVKDYSIISLDCEGRIVSWNAGAERIKGYKSQEIIGKHFSCFYKQEEISVSKPQQNLETAAAIGQFEDEGWRVRQDGTLFWADIAITALHDKNGNLRGFCKVTRDITERKQTEEYLRLLERAVAGSSDGIIITDTRSPDNPVVYVNPSFERMTGYSKWEVVGRNCRFLQGNNANQPALTELRTAIKLGRECKVVVQNYRKDGTLFWNELRISPVRNDRGEVTNFVGVQADITDRIQAEEALRQLLRREQLLGAMQARIRQSLNLEEVLNSAVDEVRQFLQTDRAILYRFEPDGSGIVVMESVAADCPSVLGSNINDPCFKKNYAFAYQQGRTSAIEDTHTAGLNPCHAKLLEQLAVRANLVVPILQGSELWGLLIAHHCRSARQWQESEVELLRQLSVQLAIAIQQAALFEQLQAELARTQAAEAALRDSEERLQAVLDNSPAVIYVKDRQGRFILVNRLFQTLFHLDRDQIVGKTNHEIFPEEIADVLHANDQQVLAAGTALEWEEVVPVEDVLHTYLSVKFPLRDADTDVPYAVCGISTDITDRVSAESALQRSNSVLKAQQEAAIDGILVIDENRKVASCNHRFREMWQISDEVMKSGDSRKLLSYVISSLKQPQEFIAKVEYLYAHPTESSRDEIYLNDGRVFDRYSAAVLSSEGNDYGRIWYFRDISDRKRNEADLQKSNQRISRILESITDAFFSLDREWRFTYVNSKAEQLLLKTNDRLIGKCLWDEFPEAVGSTFYVQYHQAVSEQVTVQFEELYPPSKTWFQVRAYPYADGLSVYFHDISDRKQAEEELRDLGAALENAVEGISRLNTQGRYIAINKAYASAVGYQPEEMIGMEWTHTIHPEDIEKMILAYQQMLIDGKVEVEVKGVRKDGSTFYKQVVMISAFDSQRRFIGYHRFMKDITQRKAAEEALRQSEILRESEAKNRVLLDAIPDAMFCIRKDGIYLDFKAAKNDDLALPAEAVIGMSVYELLPDEVAKATMIYVERTLSTGNIQIFEYQLLNDRPCDYEARLVVNGSDEVLAIVRDITERKKVERLKNEFVSIVSHELRTPLTSVRGSLSLIAGGVVGEIPPEARALLDIAYKNSERLILLINDILDIDKIESGKMDFDLKPLELMPLVQQAVEANRAYGEQFGVQLMLENALPDALVNVDRDRLIQVLTNLLSNAAKFSPPNSTVVVSTERKGQVLRVAVTDKGSGIPEEFRRRIFQKFAQADASDTRQKGGTGLGLSICKAIVEKLGGQIGFETQTNVGTTFYFDLPEWCEDSKNKNNIDDKAQAGRRILICEDDPDIAKLLSLMLEQVGLSADIAYDAARAKRLLVQNRYAAMTVDLALPGQSGISLIRELREQEHTQHLPIIVVSAKAKQGREELRGGGFAVIDWLDKPIDQVRLMAAVRQAVRQQADSKPQILHVEDDPDIAQVISAILQNIVEIDAAANLQEARQKLERKSFDLVILDLSLPDGSGLQLLPYLNNHTRSPIPAVVFSAKEVGMEAAHQVAAILVKSRTSNQQLLETIKSLISR